MIDPTSSRPDLADHVHDALIPLVTTALVRIDLARSALTEGPALGQLDQATDALTRLGSGLRELMTVLMTPSPDTGDTGGGPGDG